MSGRQQPYPPGILPSRGKSACGQEPIHIPGAIQPYGAVLAVAVDCRRVTHASANLAGILGRSADVALGRPLEAAIGEATCRELLQVTSATCPDWRSDCSTSTHTGRAGTSASTSSR
jgi:light-regulated signal transduction histidine kinase (bacteriophytochrome)